MKAKLDTQLMITVDNKAGSLADVSGLISSADINMIAICAYAVDNKGFIMFVSEDNKKAKRILKSKNYNVREEEVLVLTLDNKPGQLQAVTSKIAEVGIDLTLIYGSVDKKAQSSPLVLIGEDTDSIMTLINMMNV